MSNPTSVAAARAEFFSLGRWGYFLAAAILAAFSAALVYKLSAFQTYSEPIVGFISWNYETKSNDYALLFSFVGFFFAWLWLLSLLAARIGKTWIDGEPAFHDFLLLLCAPAGVWLAGLLTTRSTSLGFLALSVGLLLAGMGLTTLLLRRKDLAGASPAAAFTVVQKALLFVFLCMLAFAALAVGIERLGATSGSPYWVSSRKLLGVLGLIALAAVIGCAVACASMRSIASVERLLERATVAVQFALPAAFFTLIPQPWVVAGRLFQGQPMSAWAWAFIAVCVIGAYANLVRHAVRLRELPSPSPTALLAIGSLVAILLLVKTLPTGAPAAWTDDYHDGELLVPWWSLVRYHLVPFVDYTPARGLVNYVFGGLLALLFDGKATSGNAVLPFMYAGLLWLALPVLARTVGRGIAFLALLFFPYLNGISEIDVVVTVVMVVLWVGFTKWRPAAWLCAWVLLETALVLFAPGQGALATVAMAPLGLFMVWRMKQGETDGWKVAAGVLAGALVVAIVTPLAPMIFGAVRYGLEQSSVNSIAHGVQWAEGFGKTQTTNPWLYELMRTSWLLAAILAGLQIWKALRRDEDPARRHQVLLYALPILILSVLFIVRAAGRIDADGTHSRLGLASIWGVALLLPLLIFAAGRVRQFGATLFVWLAIVGFVNAGVGGVPSTTPVQADPVGDPRTSPEWVPAVAELPMVGKGVVAPAQLQRWLALRKVLDTVLAPDETYLDLSGRHATYFYLERRPPIETGSAYNLVTEKQQLRAVAALEKRPPPLVLIKADNYTHDGGPSSLRSHLVYRYLLLSNRYKVVQIGAQVWLVDASRMDKLAGLDVKAVANVADLPNALLDSVFMVPHLYNVPASWGRSSRSLEKKLTKVVSIAPGEQAGSNSIAPDGSGGFKVTAPDPYVRFKLPANLAGSDAGIVGFDFRCVARPGGPPPLIEIYWATPTNPEGESSVARLSGAPGRLLVPLDAYPSWLLAKGLQTLRFDVQAAESCSAFSVENVTLYQRSAVRQLQIEAPRLGAAGS